MPGSLHSLPLGMTGEAWAGLFVGDSSLTAGTRTPAWAGRCTRGARQDQQSPPGEPDPNGRATEQVHPLSSSPHTDFPGSEGDHREPLLSSVLTFKGRIPLTICAHLTVFHGCQALHFPGHSSLDIFPLAEFLFQFLSQVNSAANMICRF